MANPLRLISTDFDGTLFTEFENPPVPRELQTMLTRLQQSGVKWVINTGRDMSSLMEVMGRAGLEVRPDYLVLVERELYVLEGGHYSNFEDWNHHCQADHDELFDQVRDRIPDFISWIEDRYEATLYEDPWSPLCLIARNPHEAEEIVVHLEEFAKTVPSLTVVRNDVYARFSHEKYNKGAALSHLAKKLGIEAQNVFAAGDHHNDLPMLRLEHAAYLCAPANAIPEVKQLVESQGGYVSHQPCGKGVARALEYFIEVSGSSLIA